jgi:hypothetical protein
MFASNRFRTEIYHPSSSSSTVHHADVDWLVLETELDTDDGVTDSNDACRTTAGTWCHGCPQPSCGPCKYDPTCPASGAPYYAGFESTSVQCNAEPLCSAAGNNNYGIGGEQFCQGYCDGSGSCDYGGSCTYSAECDTDDDND